MNRAAVRSALGRGRVEIRWDSQRSLSTTQWVQDDQPSQPRPTTRQRLAAAASDLGSLGQSGSPSAPRVDARSLGASSPGRGGPAGGHTMINLRSLRGRLTTPRPAGRFAPSGGQGFPPRTGGPRTPFQRGGGDAGAGGFRGRGRGRGRGGGGAGGRGGKRKKKDEEAAKDDNANGKLICTPEEQDWLNRIEQGVVTPYTPPTTLESLVGHGPALATDVSIGKVEAAMRGMRILGGGKPYNPDGFFNDPKDNVNRYYHEKKPVFFDSLKEKEWLEGSQDGVRIYPPHENTKAAIIQAAVQGKYVAPKFAALNDTLGMLASYHAREATYTPTDGEKFDAKVRSLLPAQGARAKGAARPRKAAAA
ncbi:hypothetical protein QBC33DRAFT_546138 [Phialemonium atrogriseum]|uniref:Uncharacterized protein n=1 Tax=Phialemonium atrogriseum TaxID=1093897 RepID=A0AAJ0BZA4_9PEZI|nr:uncharacterized protein QBC33DRAFT_546138 [Phialemonium atrogriseum]KAK1764826.1 hypothetical protein QBC33DRAFT_546138 [Phialemonium atrogriseum]